MLIESQKVKINWYLRFIYLGISASCILTEPFFIYCNCLRNSVSYPHVDQNHVHVRFLRQETLYILSREWPYLSCTERVAKPFLPVIMFN